MAVGGWYWVVAECTQCCGDFNSVIPKVYIWIQPKWFLNRVAAEDYKRTTSQHILTLNVWWALSSVRIAARKLKIRKENDDLNNRQIAYK